MLTSHLGWPADLTYRCMGEAVVRIIESYLDGTYTGGVNPDSVRHRRA